MQVKSIRQRIENRAVKVQLIAMHTRYEDSKPGHRRASDTISVLLHVEKAQRWSQFLHKKGVRNITRCHEFFAHDRHYRRVSTPIDIYRVLQKLE